MSTTRRPAPFKFLNRLQDMIDREQEQAKSNKFLADALENEKREGHRLAIIARTIALIAVLCLLPFINPQFTVLYYMVAVIAFIGLGWLQLRMSRVGHSRAELALILVDVGLLTLLFIFPNPFMDEEVPTAMTYRFDNFIYFFIILAVGTLAYSWRTIWALGLLVAFFWLLGFLGMTFLGHQIPELSEASALMYAEYDLLRSELDPNGTQPSVRLQEMVVFVIVAAILAAKGWRSNQLLMRQANIAAERANLSRYFPASLVDVLASKEHDIGAVRSQDVAVLFTDIVGFTKYAEQHSPQEVMELLRGYHSLVEGAIFQNEGTLDKYLGDGVMATFGTPETTPKDAENALNAALQLLTEAKAFNKAREEAGLKSVQISIGVHYGPVILGDIGPSRRLEFAVVGDTVNVASRLEASTRELSCQCVVSESLIEKAHWDERNGAEDQRAFTPHDAIKLRGRETPIKIWTF